MTKLEVSSRPELRAADDATIEDAIAYADPMVLRGLLYQLTGDPEVAATRVRTLQAGMGDAILPESDADVALLRRKGAEFLKTYRDAGAGIMGIGPRERLPVSLGLMLGQTLEGENLQHHIEELAIDPQARSLRWREQPDPQRLKDFTVTIIGAGMGGLNAALQLRQAGFPFTVIEKNTGVGGTWWENRYPGARVDTASRSYTHIFGVDFPYPNPFCEWRENVKYFDWVADEFDLRRHVQFETEVKTMTWDEAAGEWVIDIEGPDGARTIRSRAVITSVGLLSRPNIPEIPGAETFAGAAWHTARWPERFDPKGKKIAVIGTGCTGYQMIPELALEAAQVTVFQRTPQWLFPTPGYRSPFPPQVNWLDRNLPFHTNFMRARACTLDGLANLAQIDPDFDDPHAVSPLNKRARDASLAFVKSKLGDPDLVAAMTPAHPVWSARAVVVDPEYSILDAIQRDNVTLVTNGIQRIEPGGVVAKDGTLHEADVIVYATGFHATEFLYPMTITGRGGQTLEALWADGGARAYLGCMMPGFPNLWSIYGPNTNGALNVASFHEKMALYALQCMETLVLGNGATMEVKPEAYWRYNRLVDERNATKAWSDPRAHNYYWTEHGRSSVMNPFLSAEMSGFLRTPDPADLEVG
ncbi:NAD(P)/FAD-dependent oxidoreductase [uncultured Phenylobacterium sp.]|uniref:flavin-containing monooxygenase n=1 Tax=uncultured Phenylobacterium sp. TaxID=349273 RepID=UPI0025DE37B8|nr:NAD(P)/FAD-dependent oxidoreductase [uncultured Phenylobacterium sp.]